MPSRRPRVMVGESRARFLVAVGLTSENLAVLRDALGDAGVQLEAMDDFSADEISRRRPFGVLVDGAAVPPGGALRGMHVRSIALTDPEGPPGITELFEQGCSYVFARPLRIDRVVQRIVALKDARWSDGSDVLMVSATDNEVTVGGRRLVLADDEMVMLRLLCERPGTIVPNDYLVTTGGRPWPAMRRLRRHLEQLDASVEVVPVVGIGYRLHGRAEFRDSSSKHGA